MDWYSYSVKFTGPKRYVLPPYRQVYKIVRILPVMITTLCLALSQWTWAPSASETNLMGTIVRPRIILGGTSRETGFPFFNVDPPILISIVVFPLWAIIFPVSPYHWTSAPNASKIPRKGTKTLPLMIAGLVSNTRLFPSITTSEA